MNANQLIQALQALTDDERLLPVILRKFQGDYIEAGAPVIKEGAVRPDGSLDADHGGRFIIL